MWKFWKSYKSQKKQRYPVEFSCSYCNESNTIFLPEYTYKMESDDTDINFHNFDQVVKCPKCEFQNSIYYCTNEHDFIAKCSVCGEEGKIAKVLSSRTGNNDWYYCNGCATVQP